MNNDLKVEKQRHHEQQEECQSRARYRQGRRLTAVKVYTVNDESKYMIINGVPAIKIESELERLCLKYGDVECLQLLRDYPREEYTEVYLLKYHTIRSARFAKIHLDRKSFFGGVLHVCYAPELETVGETREKLEDRRRSVAALTRYRQDAASLNPPKRKKNKVLNPAAERYLAHLRPELKNVYEDILPTGEGPPGPSEVLGGRIRPEFSSSFIFRDKHCTPFISSDSSITSQASTISKVTDMSYPNNSQSKANVPQTSLQGNECTLFPQQKRQNKFPYASSSNKKIKVFGNKKILSYKVD